MVIKVEIRSNRRNRPQHYLIHLSLGVGYKNDHFQKHRGPNLFDAEYCSDEKSEKIFEIG